MKTDVRAATCSARLEDSLTSGSSSGRVGFGLGAPSLGSDGCVARIRHPIPSRAVATIATTSFRKDQYQ